jgi:hypothetical protein
VATDPIDLQEQIARIKNAQAETDKFAAEQRKLAAEASKLIVDRWMLPFAVLINLVSGAMGGALVAYLLRH